jgi:hypothetical protein
MKILSKTLSGQKQEILQAEELITDLLNEAS